MKVMWAPWRMEYILSPNKENGCFLCPDDSRKNEKERLVLRTDSCTLIMMNRFPYNNGHLLVAPIRHLSGLELLTIEEMQELMRNIRDSIEILKKFMHPEGFNVGLNLGRVAGAGVEGHLHFHIVPRWNGDTNMMTVIGDVRVVPEHIMETYGKLVKLFSKDKSKDL